MFHSQRTATKSSKKQKPTSELEKPKRAIKGTESPNDNAEKMVIHDRTSLRPVLFVVQVISDMSKQDCGSVGGKMCTPGVKLV